MKNKTVNKKSAQADLNDPLRDQERMKDEPISIDMPEVKDIPGQEHIRVPKMREMYDTTISSDDEEGTGILDDINNDDDLLEDENSNVSRRERRDLKKSIHSPVSDEAKDLKNIALDSTDNDGDELNEKGFKSNPMGKDLDVPGTDLDDDDESIGDEDEENNMYSGRD